MTDVGRTNLPPLSLHVPEPKYRPGDPVAGPFVLQATVLAADDLVAVENKANPRSYLAQGETPARFYVDSLVHDPDALSFTVSAAMSRYPCPM